MGPVRRLTALCLPVLGAASAPSPELFGKLEESTCPNGKAAEKLEAPSVSLMQTHFSHRYSSTATDPEVAHKEAFMTFINTHQRAYQHDEKEFKQRYENFRAALLSVQAQNSRPERLWTAGINHLADWSPEEHQLLRGWRGTAAQRGPIALGQGSERDISSLPADFQNWTRLETAKKIKDQGACGSCWAVASATVLQAHTEIYSDSTKDFSVQELVSCVSNPMECGGTGGCEGATAELAMDYVSRHGLRLESEVPYKAESGKCPPSSDSSVLAEKAGDDASPTALATPGVHSVLLQHSSTSLGGMKAWERLPENRMEPLMRAIVEHGPVIVSVSAESAWNFYLSGIYNSCSADAVINHAVAMIGYGVAGTNKFWTIQNSWGPSWGENGHMRLLRRDDDDKQCGTDNQPEVGTGCKGGPASVTVCGMCGILYDSVVPHYN